MNDTPLAEIRSNHGHAMAPHTLRIDDDLTAKSITPALVWRALCKWWMYVVPLGLLLGTVAGVTTWYSFVPVYEASSLVIIEEMMPYIAFDQTQTSASASEKYIQTQIELLRSDVVLGPVLSRAEIASMEMFKGEMDKLRYLKDHLTLQQVGKSELYNIKFVSPSARDSATVVNAIVSEYLAMQSDEDFKSARRVIDILEEERVRRLAEVERLRQRVVDLAKTVTGKDPFGQDAVIDYKRVASPINSIYHDLTESDVELEVLEAEIQSLQDAEALIPDYVEVSGIQAMEIANRADVQLLQDEIRSIELESEKRLTETQAKLIDWEADDLYVQLQKEMASKKAALKELKDDVAKELREQRQEELRMKRAEVIAAKKTELSKVEARRDLLVKKFDEHVSELKTGSANSVELEFARAELSREEKVFELIAARKLALQTELRAPARVRPRKEATPPLLAQVPFPFKGVFLATAVGFLSPFGLAISRELTLRRITGSEELRQETRVPVLGEIARFPVRPTASRVHSLPTRQRRQMFVFAESIDSLRMNLMLPDNLGPCQVLAVVSAASGEGKTSVATSLAGSYAAATQRKTLLIDADLRSPEIDSLLPIKQSPGLSDVLSGKAALAESIHQVPGSHTYVLPAGRTRINPHQWVQPKRIAEIVTALRKDFATIIIDTPPILGASEALVYAKEADAVLLCSLSGVSQRRHARAAIERLWQAGASVTGTVLSGVSLAKHGPTYYYGFNDQESST